MFKHLVYVILFGLILYSNNSFSQKSYGTISGFIHDAKNGEALIGANVNIQGTHKGASTNLNGYFAIPEVEKGEHTIQISFIGYKPESIKVNISSGENEILKINLKEVTIQTNEIVIKGDSVRVAEKLYEKPISKIDLNAAQINNIPRVIEADLLRSLQTLPGIQPLSDFSSALYIRGGTPDQNLYLIDGTDVYNPEHAFGIFSTFNTSAIKKVELSKGGFGAEYGGRLSSVLNVTNLDGDRYNFKGDVNISLISASATIQTPLGSIGSLSGSFRRTYIDQTYAKIIDEIPDYYFYDGNLKAYLDLDDKNKLIVSFYSGKDDLDFKLDKDRPSSLGFLYDWGNTTGSINWRRIITQKLFANFWVTASRFSSNFDFDGIDLSEKNVISDYSAKGNLEYYALDNFSMKFGFEYKRLHGLVDQTFPGGRVDVSKFRNHYIGYVSSNWKPIEDLVVETGLRFDYFNSDKNYWNLDPRFSLKYKLDETSSLKFSTGAYHQYLNRIPRMFIASLWTSADEYVKGSSAYHFIFGYQKELFQIYEFEAEVFFKRYNNVSTYNQNYLTVVNPTTFTAEGDPIFNNTKGLFSRGDGNSYGLELMVRKDYGAITGWMGYSFSKTENTIDGLNKGKAYTPRHDRTHTVNTVINININDLIDEINDDEPEAGGSKWLTSFNFVYSTGQPITLPASIYSVETMPGWNINQGNVAMYPSEINSVRLPPYIRLDFSLTWEKNFGSWTLAPYLQIFNVGNRKNVWFISYENNIVDGQVKQKIESVNMMPILPSLGVNIKF